jgi:phosphopantothenoylcysteine decarboxylase/phosphopantothenate--cysteine ligase
LSVLIAAGPTHEPIDAVRYLANRSTGRMGLALVDAALSRGLDVTLLLGPTTLAPPVHSQLVTRRFRTTADLQHLLADEWPSGGDFSGVPEVLIMAAAVADFRPAEPADPDAKLSRGRGPWALALEPTPDLLAEAAAAARPGQMTIGFALEPSQRMLESARRKLAAKGADAIVANPLETLGAEEIRATVVLADGRQISPPASTNSKSEFAEWLMGMIERRFQEI